MMAYIYGGDDREKIQVKFGDSSGDASEALESKLGEADSRPISISFYFLYSIIVTFYS